MMQCILLYNLSHISITHMCLIYINQHIILTIKVTMFEAEVVDSIVDFFSDIDSRAEYLCCCELDGCKVVANNVDFEDFLVERGN